MIIWINGAFGSGKTQTAFELNRRLVNSFVFDPENVGFFLRKNLPESLTKGDFQNIPLWREFTFKTLKHIHEGYDGVIIVPMTVTCQEYYDETVAALEKTGADVRHFILSASRETLRHRLKSRLETEKSWAAQQIERCINAFETDITKTKIETDQLNVCQTAEKIAELSGLTLAADNRSPVKKAIDRGATQIRHIR